MSITFKKRILAAALVSIGMAFSAQAQVSDDLIKIAVMNDMSGTYADIGGKGSVLAAEMAIQDMAKDGVLLGKKVELISADHLNKADVAANKAREWFEKDKVDAIFDLSTSSASLAVTEIAKQKNRLAVVSTAGSLALTNEKCTPVTLHWTYDTYALTAGTAKAVVESGKKKWYFLTADYALGHSLEEEAARVVRGSGGEVLGTVRHPFPGSDFSSFLLGAQASGAEIIALANAGSDMANSIKQAAEFGIGRDGKQTLLPLLMFISDVHALGLESAQGLMLTEAFYWDRNEKTRAWSQRFFKAFGKMPTSAQAGVYSSVAHYLKAVEATGTDETTTVMNWIKSNPVNDGLFEGEIRADGKFAHDVMLVQVKSPKESTGPWDYYNILSVIPAADANLPLSQSKCELVK